MRILILLILVMLPIVGAVEECKKIQPPAEIPCRATSTWAYANCTTENATVYNASGANLQNYSFLAHGGSDFCFFTWNITDSGSYTFEVTNGDSGNIHVESEEEVTSLAITIFLLLINAGLFILPQFWQLSSSEALHNLFKKMMYIGGLLFLTFNTTIMVTLADSAGLGISNELFFYQYIFLWGIYISMIFLFFNMVVTTVKMWKQEKQRKRMGDE